MIGAQDNTRFWKSVERKIMTADKPKRDSKFMARIGAMGGKNSNNGGFASQKVGADGLTGRERAAKAGQMGGKRSKRPTQTKKGL